jgi:hypothetical protein
MGNLSLAGKIESESRRGREHRDSGTSDQPHFHNVSANSTHVPIETGRRSKIPNPAQRDGEPGRSCSESRPVSAHVQTDSHMKCLLPGPAHPFSTAVFIDPKREFPAEVPQVQTLRHSDQATLHCAPSQSQSLSRNQWAEHSSIDLSIAQRTDCLIVCQSSTLSSFRRRRR